MEYDERDKFTRVNIAAYAYSNYKKERSENGEAIISGGPRARNRESSVNDDRLLEKKRLPRGPRKRASVLTIKQDEYPITERRGLPAGCIEATFRVTRV
ncbi:hypothetical protein KM043_002882 [Ampulex compressa]|nr:hypothetical protein KM043_002882 [Ampulex compressa]